MAHRSTGRLIVGLAPIQRNDAIRDGCSRPEDRWYGNCMDRDTMVTWR
jgi:hypothetical protein